MVTAPRDDNQIPVLMGVSNVDGTTPVTIYVDPTTHRVLTSATVSSVNDDILLNLGTDNDIALVLRSTSLAANTALTDVIVGTPVVPAIPANSLIVSNITADGDIVFVTNTGGNSIEAMRIDASTRSAGK